MRRWCRYAGIPRCTFHVLRKTRNGHVAESGARDAQGRTVTGHTKDSTFACCARLAGREALADIAMSNPKKGMELQMFEKRLVPLAGLELKPRTGDFLSLCCSSPIGGILLLLLAVLRPSAFRRKSEIPDIGHAPVVTSESTKLQPEQSANPDTLQETCPRLAPCASLWKADALQIGRAFNLSRQWAARSFKFEARM